MAPTWWIQDCLLILCLFDISQQIVFIYLSILIFLDFSILFNNFSLGAYTLSFQFLRMYLCHLFLYKILAPFIDIWLFNLALE